MSYLWNPVPAPIFTSTGAFAAGAMAYFYTGNSSTPLVVYADSALTVALSWPVIANLNGVFPPIYIPYGSYRRRIVTAQGELISDTGNIDNPAPPTSGGGIIVQQNQVFNTGYAFWTLRAGQLSGFVRMNGNTIGDASSGATEYAANDASALFTFLWSYLPNSIAGVSGGRGVSAAADFAANKTIVVPTMQGFAAAGVDDMGATALAKIQAITTCNTDGINAQAIVASATGIAVGQNVIINGVAIGTVTSISGTTIGLSAVPVNGTGVSFRSSWFSDATQLGASAGSANQTITSDQMPPHNHTINETPHSHGLNNGVNYAAGAAVGAAQTAGVAQQTGTAVTNITINNTGGGHPFELLQPSRLGTWYMKL